MTRRSRCASMLTERDQVQAGSVALAPRPRVARTRHWHRVHWCCTRAPRARAAVTSAT